MEGDAYQLPRLLQLPSESLLNILRYLNYKDLLSCSEVCRRLNKLVEDETLWKDQCSAQFLLRECPENVTWRELFCEYFAEFGNCINSYKAIRKAWNQIEAYLDKYDPVIKESLQGPATEGELQQAERTMKCSFPLDLRCSLKIHNGQAHGAGPGLMGCMAVSSYFRSEKILDCKTMADNYEDYTQSGELEGCVPLTFCFLSRRSQLVAISEEGGFPLEQVFYPCPDNTSSVAMDHFITGYSYTEWFTKFAQELANDVYPRIRGSHFRFCYDPSCVTVTADVFTVKVATCFMPELSTVNPPHFFFTYRISMMMDKDADKAMSCQLETRHWIITDEDGNEERVDGPGVVGDHPIMRPGEEYSWISCTTFSTTYGNMKGHFTMRNLEDGTELNIECPVFHMKCLPYEYSEQRKQRREERKKNL